MSFSCGGTDKRSGDTEGSVAVGQYGHLGGERIYWNLAGTSDVVMSVGYRVISPTPTKLFTYYY